MIGRGTKRGSLITLKEQGFDPQLVFDVGVYHGTPELYEVFPSSTHILIEPIAEHESHLKNICDNLPNATYMVAAASSKTGSTNIRINKELTVSSIIDNNQLNASEEYTYREIQTIAIDDLFQDLNLAGPFLIKIDVDGLETDVLNGALNALKKTEVAIVEVTLLGQMYEVMRLMEDNGFVAFDIVEPLYRPKDNLLWQVDMFFVKENSKYREDKSWT